MLHKQQQCTKCRSIAESSAFDYFDLRLEETSKRLLFSYEMNLAVVRLRSKTDLNLRRLCAGFPSISINLIARGPHRHSGDLCQGPAYNGPLKSPNRSRIRYISVASSNPNKPLTQIPQTARPRFILSLRRQRLRKGGATFLLAIAPAPMHAGLREGGVVHHLRDALAGEFLRHVAFGDVLLEPGKNRLEGLRRVAEQGRVGHTAGVQRVEHDAGFGVIAAVQLAADDHVAKLAVFVGLAGFEGLAVDHRDRVPKTRLQTLQVAQVGRRGDGHFATEFLGVRGDRAQSDEPAGWLVRAL